MQKYYRSNKITIPFQFSDLSANVFRNIIKDYRKLQYIKEEIKEIKKGILDELKPDNYLYTNIETPIFTIKTNKYENLSAELRRNGIIVENCCTFLNLDNRYARIRIPREWKKLLEVLVNIVQVIIKKTFVMNVFLRRLPSTRVRTYSSKLFQTQQNTIKIIFFIILIVQYIAKKVYVSC